MYRTWATASRNKGDGDDDSNGAERLTIGRLAQRTGLSAKTIRYDELAQRTGLSAKTIRYYEEIGLLPRPPRAPNGYRRYGVADINRLLLLQRIRLLGVPLSQAKSLLAGASDARCADVQRELQALVDARATALDREIAELQFFRAELAAYQRALAACQPDEDVSFSACQDMRCIAPASDCCVEEQDYACC